MSAEDDAAVVRDLATLEAELKRLEAEYNMFFAGRLPRPPWETRSRVDALVKRIDRARAGNTGDRFKFSTLQARFTTFIDLWDRGLRAREEGRGGPFAQPRPSLAEKPSRPEDRVVGVVRFSGQDGESDNMRSLYDRLAEARRAAGQEAVPYDRFAELIKTQVSTLQKKGDADVAFRVAIKNGKVALSARVVKPGKPGKAESGS
jgi:hypothetical protein